jgi:hypothetical protein
MALRAIAVGQVCGDASLHGRRHAVLAAVLAPDGRDG